MTIRILIELGIDREAVAKALCQQGIKTWMETHPARGTEIAHRFVCFEKDDNVTIFAKEEEIPGGFTKAGA